MQRTGTAALAGLMIGLISASASATDDPEKCAAVNSPITASFFVDGCTSPFGLCTAGVIPSGLLTGTTLFTVLTLQPGETPDILLYTGELVISTFYGDVVIQDQGALSQVDGTFFEFDEVVSGTGKFTNANGTLFSQGVNTGTGFDSTISGQICGTPDNGPILD